MPPSLRRLWLLWIPLVWFLSFPWIGFTSEPQWHRVHLVPLTDPGDKPRDIIANFMLFLPFGYSVARRRAPLWALGRSAGLAAVVSVSAEAMQVFSTARYPSATDVMVGAFAHGQPEVLHPGDARHRRGSGVVLRDE